MMFRRPIPGRPLAAACATAAALALGGAILPAALAQPAATPPAGTPAQPAAAPPAGGSPGQPAADQNPLVARVEGQEVRLSDVIDVAADVLPAELRALPPAVVAGMIPPDALRQMTDRAITERALVAAARKAGLDRDPEVRRRLRRAEEQELQQALLSREVGALVTEEALRARYGQESGRRQGEEEVHARHILVPTEGEARQALAEVTRPGADFAAVARRLSTGPGAQEGGDLGFFKRGDMIPEFADAAFALQPGQVSPQPVRTGFGWHVIKVEERRSAPVPPFEEVRDSLRQRMMEEQVGSVLQRIRGAAAVEMAAPEAPPARVLMDNAAPPAPSSPGGRGGAAPPPPSPAQPRR